MTPIAAGDVRYIKLGREGDWFKDCRAKGCIALGHDEAPHALAQARKWREVEAEVARRRGGIARDVVRELRDFYETGHDVLWITFDEDHLWWAFADAEVRQCEPEEGPGFRFRRTLSDWQCKDVAGAPLTIAGLSTRLTRTRHYRRTICEVEAKDYLLRRINALPEPAVEKAREAHAGAIAAARDLIASLHPSDFELLADLIFQAGGWRRLSVVGETMKDADLLLEQPVTRERAFVQAKSRATPRVLSDYIVRYRARGEAFQRMFFLCHSFQGRLPALDDDVTVWRGDVLAEQAIRSGLMQWLIERNL